MIAANPGRAGASCAMLVELIAASAAATTEWTATAATAASAPPATAAVDLAARPVAASAEPPSPSLALLLRRLQQAGDRLEEVSRTLTDEDPEPLKAAEADVEYVFKACSP